MTFLSELKRLREAATKDHMYQNKLSTYLYNQAESIEELVRAAEQVLGCYISDPVIETELREALAKLEKP